MLATVFYAHGLLMDVATLAATALLGYLFFRRHRTAGPSLRDAKLLDELARASLIAEQLENVAARLSAETGTHRRSFSGFNSQIESMQAGAAEADWPKLRECADDLLGATWRLATSLSLAGDQLRHQQTQLITFSSSRIDPTTGLHNRRSMEEHLDALIAMHADGQRRFALAVFSVAAEPDEAEAAGETRLRLIARLLQECIRDNDFVARYSDDEFVVIMPQTTLAGAVAFGQRLLRRCAAHLRSSMWGGVVEAMEGETAQKLLSRADSALYSARAEGVACMFQHTGTAVRRYGLDSSTATAAPDADPAADAIDQVEELLAGAR